MTSLILIGGGGHCQSVIDIVESLPDFRIEGILDIQDKVGHKVLDYDIIGTNNDIERLVSEGHNFLITVGQIKTAEIRKALYWEVKNKGGKLSTLVAPSAQVSNHCVIGEGSIIMHYSFLNAGVRIGVNNIINTRALIEHGVEIGDHCHVSTAAVINGDAGVSDEVFVGSNATIFQGVEIGSGSVIGGGAIVKQNVPEKGLVK